MDKAQRKALEIEILSSTGKGKSSREFQAEIQSGRFDTVGFCPSLPIISLKPLSREKKGEVSTWVFSKPMLLIKDMHSPLLVVTGESLPHETRWLQIPDEIPSQKEGSEVVSFLSWCKVVAMASPERRRSLQKILLSDLAKYRSKEGVPTATGLRVKEALESKLFDCIGFAPNVMYLKVKGNAEEMQALYIHPWGTPKLIYKHRRLPVLVIVGGDLRLNESIIGEVKANEYRKRVGGLTG